MVHQRLRHGHALQRPVPVILVAVPVLPPELFQQLLLGPDPGHSLGVLPLEYAQHLLLVRKNGIQSELELFHRAVLLWFG